MEKKVTTMRDGEWEITTIEEAEKVINIQQRWLVQDAERLSALADRIRELERPRWRRLLFGRAPW